jgi:adenine-specific DNA-methyltransferase
MSPRIGKPTASTPVTATRHPKERRVNIPTAELESFARDDERHPKTVLYPRDPSLDPQLVWKGKDEQDQHDLTVPAVPIYIQEQIEPRAIIEDLRAQTAAGREQQLDLFSDFNGVAFEERVDFYRHPMHWTNRLVLGNSLHVMTSLAEKEGLKGQVQTIYLDPPYGIKFGSNWQVSTRKRDVKDGRAEDATRQPEQVQAFRDTWQLGIHSYLSYLRDRLVVARELLTESGSIFVQIGDDNLHLVRNLLDEVFGAESFCSVITFQKTAGLSSPMARTNVVASVADFVLWYAKDKTRTKYRQLYLDKGIGSEGAGVYSWIELADHSRRRMTTEEREGRAPLPHGARVFRVDNVTSMGPAESGSFPVEYQGRRFGPGSTRHWTTTQEGMKRLAVGNRLVVSGDSLAYVRYHDDFRVQPMDNVWTDVGTGSFTDPKVYIVQTNTKVVDRCLLMTTDPGDLVLDPTCGSGTTAYVAEHWGRRWITIDTSRVALALARTRLMAAKYPYYLLADSPVGRRKEADLTGQPVLDGPTEGDIRQGFVYERVPHVTLKSIAQNTDISEGMTRAEIDAAIVRHTESEILFDRPFEDRKIVRVAGPFTVESLSPHRVVADGPEDAPAAEQAPLEESGRFVATILDNLRASGVDNRVKGERLRFETLEPYPGTWLQADGTYLEADTQRRAAIALGPEYGTVGAELIRSAALEAARGGFDLLVVCGFAFDAQSGEQATSLGRLTVLRANMNPDLHMAEDLLKKTRAGNLFTVFGEPDVEVRDAGDGQLVVEIRGLDVYDPTTGEIRSASTDDIACWFIDTAYNGEAFFVRHAYFCGGDEPYDRLKRALRAEIDESAWSSLYSTVSRPFPRPTTGRIAVKVINHYGDEVLKVYALARVAGI